MNIELTYQFLIVFIVYYGLHLAVARKASIVVANFMSHTRYLLDKGRYTDGCTTPLKIYIHQWLSRSKALCAAHDYGGLGLIPNVKPGIHCNWVTWLAHMSERNPVYWLWGTVVSVWTLPWVILKHDFKLDLGDNSTGVGVIQVVVIGLYFLIKFQPEMTG